MNHPIPSTRQGACETTTPSAPRLRYCALTLLSVAAMCLASCATAATSTDEQVESLLNRMTLDEKIGQMTQVDTDALKDKSHIQKYSLGSVLSGGGSDPTDNSPQAWLNLANECQSWAGKTRLKIPLLYGVDAVHGHNNVIGAVIFPHNIGLGATRNPQLVEQAARVTALEVAGTGINWAFAPCVAVAMDARWGRTYESFSESPDLAGELGAAAVRGFQGTSLRDSTSVLACAKHFVGDGGTQGGVDQGNTVVDEATLRSLHLSPYLPALKAGAGSVMVSFNSWNGEKLHGHKYLLTDVLKGELGFKGFVVSDWAGIDQLSPDYKASIAKAVNAGLDMAMVPNGPGQPNSYIDYISKLKELVDEGTVPLSRIDDAVRRILRVKLEMGLMQERAFDPALTAAIGSPQHREVARQCVRESLVLLKNERGTLPLSKKQGRLAVVGAAADDLGRQCGGWTIGWQGESGKVTEGGTTILEAIRKAVDSNTEVVFSPDGSGLSGVSKAIVVIGEMPYAEMKGDREELSLSPADVALVKHARSQVDSVVTVLISGRPLVLGDALSDSDALVAAWLPGSEGAGVSDVLFGDFKPKGKLPREWPGTETQAPGTNSQHKSEFAFGFGLSFDRPTQASNSDLKTASTH